MRPSTGFGFCICHVHVLAHATCRADACACHAGAFGSVGAATLSRPFSLPAPQMFGVVREYEAGHALDAAAQRRAAASPLRRELVQAARHLATHLGLGGATQPWHSGGCSCSLRLFLLPSLLPLGLGARCPFHLCTAEPCCSCCPCPAEPHWTIQTSLAVPQPSSCWTAAPPWGTSRACRRCWPPPAWRWRRSRRRFRLSCLPWLASWTGRCVCGTAANGTARGASLTCGAQLHAPQFARARGLKAPRHDAHPWLLPDYSQMTEQLTGMEPEAALHAEMQAALLALGGDAACISGEPARYSGS